MHRIFLNANVLFPARICTEHGLQRLWKLKDVILCSSKRAAAEARAKLTESRQHSRLKLLLRPMHLFDATRRDLFTGVSLPRKDVLILLAAIEAQATQLMTGDLQHFAPCFGIQG
jgi:uncharacterized protein